MQKTVNFTGIEDFLNHDACATESMGPIFDRSKEHLGVSDKAVIAVRKFSADFGERPAKRQKLPHIVHDPETIGFRMLTVSRICYQWA